MIRTERLTLCPLRPGDEAALVRGLGDWRVASWMGRVPHPYTADHATDAIRRLAVPPPYVLDDGTGLVGMVGLGEELSYWLDPSVWSRGYATEACRAVLDAHPKRPVRAGAFLGNAASAAVLTRLGFVPDGVDDQPCLARGTILARQVYRLDA